MRVVKPLDPYQEEGAAWLTQRTRALLADEQGLGKTWQAIRAADYAVMMGLVPCPAKIVLITPASLRDNWNREIAAVSLDPTLLKVHQYSYEGAVSALNKGGDAAKVIKSADIVIIDESHYLKTPSSDRTRVIFHAVGPTAKYLWCLSGTPCPNDPSEIWSHLWFMDGDRLKDARGETMREHAFIARYFRTRNTTYGEKVIGLKPQCVADYDKMLDGFMLRRMKAEVRKDLPPIRWGSITLRCASDSWASVKEFEGHLADGYVDADDLPAPDEDMMRMRRLIADAKVAPLVSILKEELQNDPKHKVVIFGHHKDPLARIAETLEKFEPAMITGDTPINKRQAQVDNFQNNSACQVFIGNIKAAGTGLTLTASHNLIFLEQSWTPGENAQAAMRVHRIGQTQPVLIRVAALAGTIDEDVQAVLSRKTAMLADVGLHDEINTAA